MALRPAPHPLYMLHCSRRHEVGNQPCNLLPTSLPACDARHIANVQFLPKSFHPPGNSQFPTSAFRAAHATAIAITQSSCVPEVARAVPSPHLTNVRNSFSSRTLRNTSGSSSNTDNRFSIITGRLADVVNHPSAPPCLKICG